MDTIITASDKEWLANTLKAYFEKKKFTFIDDMGFGFDKDDFLSALKFISSSVRKANKNWIRILQVLSGLGLSATGI